MAFPGLRAALKRRQESPFCTDCGSVRADAGITCGTCGKLFRPAQGGEGESIRVLEASETVKDILREKSSGERVSKADAQLADQATIQEQCPQCKHVGLSFRTAQLRSADEGQTIFYTCPECKYVQRKNAHPMREEAKKRERRRYPGTITDTLHQADFRPSVSQFNVLCRDLMFCQNVFQVQVLHQLVKKPCGGRIVVYFFHKSVRDDTVSSR